MIGNCERKRGFQDCGLTWTNEPAVVAEASALAAAELFWAGSLTTDMVFASLVAPENPAAKSNTDLVWVGWAYRKFYALVCDTSFDYFLDPGFFSEKLYLILHSLGPEKALTAS